MRTDERILILSNNMGRLEGGRFHDPIYNDENVEDKSILLVVVGLMVGISTTTIIYTFVR